MANDIRLLSGRVKKTPATEADPGRYDFLDLQNAEPDLGVPAANGAPLISDTTGNREWATSMTLDSQGANVLGNLDVQGNVTANYFVGNIDGANITIIGNLQADYFIGNIDGTTGVFSGNVTANTFIGDLVGNITGNIDAGGANTTVQFNDDDVLAGSPAFTFDKSANLVTVTGNVQADWFLGNVDGIQADFSGNVDAGNVIAQALVSAAEISASGNVSANNANIVNSVSAQTGAFVGNVSADTLLGNVSGTTGSFTGNVSANTLLGNVDGTTGSFTGNVSAANVTASMGVDATSVSASGNVSANNVTAINIVSAQTAEVTGNLAAGNVNVQDVITATEIQANVQGTTASFSGNLEAQNITANAAIDTTTLSASGNISGANVDTTGQVSATGNVQGGNLVTGGDVSASTGTFSGNVTAGNISVTGAFDTATISATGNITGNNLVANNAVSTVTISASGNVSGANIIASGQVSATGNVSGGNLTTGGAVVAVGNVAGGNITTNGVVSAGTGTFSGNVTAGNVNVTGAVGAAAITSSGNISGANLISANDVTTVTVTASGNVAGANITTAGQVSATGNVTGGNLVSGAAVSTVTLVASGNISAANVTASQGVSAQNGVFSGNVQADTFLATTLVQSTAITASGNIQGANVIANGAVYTTTVEATGNITAANVNANLGITAANATVNYVAAGTLYSNDIQGTDLEITAANVDLVLTGNLDLGTRWINRVANPLQAQDAATKQYVDDAVSAGLTIHPPVRLEVPASESPLNGTYAQGGTTYTVTDTVAGNTVVFSTAANLQVNDQLWFTTAFEGIVANLAYFVVSAPNTSAAVLSTTYNGEPVANITSNTGLSQSVRVNSGQGATLTNAGANAALVVDGVTVATNDRILVYNQSPGSENGVYVVTVPGDAGNAWVLTRAADMDTYIPDNINGVDVGDYFFVQEGDTGAGESYVMTDPTGPLIIGYNALTFTQFSAASTYQAGNGLSLNGTIFSVNVDDDTTAIVADVVVVKAGANLVQPNIGNATGNSLSLTGNGLLSATTVTALGNVSAGNVVTTGLMSAALADITGNVLAGNVGVTGLVSAASVTASGNVTAANANIVNTVTATLISASGNVAANNLVSTNDVTTATVTASGNVSANNVVSTNDVSTVTVTASGNVSGANLVTAGTVSASTGAFSGNVTAANIDVNGNIDVTGTISATGNISTQGFFLGTFEGNISGNLTAPGANTEILYNQSGNAGAGPALTFDYGSNVLSVLGTANVSGNVSGNNVTATNDVATVTVTASGNISGANISATGNVAADYFLGNVQGDVADFSGNVSANYFLGNGSQLTGIDATSIQNGTSNVRVLLDSDVTVGIAGTSNIAVFSAQGIDVQGNVDATGNVSGQWFVGNVDGDQAQFLGNVSAGNIDAQGLISGATITASGNVLGGNLVSQADVTTVTVTATGNVDAGNVNTTGTIDATGNISTQGFFLGTFAGNISGNLTAPGANTEVLYNQSGNAGASAALTFDYGANVLTVTGTANVSGNISADYFLGNGSQLTGIDATSIQNGTSNVRVLQDSDVTVGIAGTSNVAVFSTSGLDVLGNVTANLFQGNVQAAGSNTWVQFNDQGILGATSRFAFDTSSNTVIVTGNVDTGNLTVVDDITANRAAFTGNVSVANLTAIDNIEAVSGQFSGNVTASNLVATEGTYGNIYTGNILSTDPVTNIITMMANLDIMGNAMIATGLQVLGTITANAVAAQASTLTLTSAPGQEIILHAQAGANIDVRNSKIANLANPVANTDAATKQYVDSIAQGLSIKNSVVVATATELPAYVYNNGASGIGANITAQANGVITIDGESLAQFDRVLVKDEIGGNAPYNGIYVVTDTGSVGNVWILTRSDDMELPEEFPGAFTFVQEGATQADTGWVCITDRPVIIGITDIEFTQFSGSGTYQAGNGLSLIGNTFSVNVDEITTTIVADNVVVRDDAVFVTPNIGNATGVSLDLLGNLSAGNITSNTTITVDGDRIYLADLQLVAVSSNTFGVYENDGVTLANLQIGNVEVAAISSGTSAIGISGPNGNAYIDVNGVANVVVVSSDLVTVQGNVTADYFLGNGSLLTGIDTTSIQNGTSKVNTFLDANVTISAEGNSNVVVVTGDGMDVVGNVSASYVLANGSQMTGINSFGVIQVAGESNVVANAVSDTLTFVASSGITILTDPANNVIEISSQGAGTSIFATGGNMGLITGNVTSSEDLGVITVLADIGYDLGSVTWIIDGMIVGDLIPAANVTYDIGSLTNRWNNIYLDGNTIFLGPLQLKSVNSSTFGVFTADGSTLANLEVGNIANGIIGSISNGVTEVGIDGSGGDVYFDIDGIQDILRASIIGVSVTGGVTATGNVTGNYIFGNGSQLTGINSSASAISNGTARVDTVLNGNVTVDAGGTADVATFSASGVSITGEITATGNITGDYILGNGSQLTGISTDTNRIFNGTTEILIATANGNVAISVDSQSNIAVFSTQGVDVSGNVEANYFIGNGSQLTGLPAGYANADAVAYGESGWAGNIIPAANNEFSLGSETNQWAEIWVANNTLYIGTVAVAVSGNVLTVAGEPVLTNDSNTSISTSGNVQAGNLLADLGQFIDIQGNLVTANQPNITAVGTLNSLTVSGNIEAGNVSATEISGIIATAGQPNITAVGTLASLSVSGNIQAGNVSATNITGTVATASQPNITSLGTLSTLSVTGNVQTGNVAATNISGTLTTASQTNITAVGTLVSLSVSGNIQGGNVSATNVAGTLETAAQPNVTSVGTLTALGVTGNVQAGNVSATNISGTLTTASQPNVTSVGTLGSLAVTGNVQAGNVQATDITATGNVDAVNVNTDAVTALGSLTLAATDLVMALAGNIDMNQSLIRDLAAPVSSSDAATKQYVDDAVSSGIHIHDPVQLETPTALPSATYAQGGTVLTVTDTVAANTVVFSTAANLQPNDQLWFASTFEGISANTAYFVVSAPNTSAAVLSTAYNGEPVTTITANTGLSQSVRVNSGVGATLTATANGALTVDGVSVSNSDRILVYNQASELENGVYVVSDTGNVSAPWILTRATDADQYVPDTNDGIDQGSYFFVQAGDTGAGESYVMTQPTGPFIIGFDAIEFTQFAASQVYTANAQAGISLTGTVFSAQVDGVTTDFDAGGNLRVRPGAVLTTPDIGAASGTSLNVSGNVAAGNVSGTTGDFTNVGGTLTTAAQTNVTSLGTLTALDVTGNVAAGNVSGTNIAGTLSTAAQPNVTSLGTLASLLVTGNVTAGNVSGTLLTGTLSTAAQPNVTSLGTLISLSVTGNVATGNVSGTLGEFTRVSGNGSALTALSASSISSGTLDQARLANASITVNSTSVSLGGSATITANTTNSLTFNNGGAGAASGTTFNGGSAQTISYNTLGAAPTAGSTSITTLGTIATGTWQGNVISTTYTAAKVSSVDVLGGTTGLTTSGGPITGSGTITLGGTLNAANGGTGRTSLTLNNVVLGNGTGAVQFVAPGTNGNVLTSNGTTWVSTAPAASGISTGKSIALSMFFGL